MVKRTIRNNKKEEMGVILIVSKQILIKYIQKLKVNYLLASTSQLDYFALTIEKLSKGKGQET